MTDYTLKNPAAPLLPDPIGLDSAVQDIQVSLTSLTWLTKSFGRAREVNKIPMVYQGKKEYYTAMPNDTLKAYSFFRLNGDKRLDDEYVSDSLLFLTAPVDVIFWCNLKEIDKTKDHIHTEELINDVFKILTQYPTVKIIRVWDEKPDDVFKGYEISKHRDLLMYPYAAFRIEITLKYEQSLC